MVHVNTKCLTIHNIIMTALICESGEILYVRRIVINNTAHEFHNIFHPPEILLLVIKPQTLDQARTPTQYKTTEKMVIITA